MGPKGRKPRARKQRRTSTASRKRTQEIRDLCAISGRIAGRPESAADVAADLIARDLSLEAARREVVDRLAAESDEDGEIQTRPHPDGPPTELRFKPALPAYMRWREAQLVRMEHRDRADGLATTSAEWDRRKETVARWGYRMLVEDHGLPDEFAAWERLKFERVRAQSALRRLPSDEPLTAEGEAAQRRQYEEIVAALAVLPIPAATDPLDVADPAVLEVAVDTLVECGAARDRDEAARILLWRHRTDRTDHLAAMIRAQFHDELGVEIEREDVREAAGGFARKQPRRVAPTGRGRPRASDFNQAVAALDRLVRQLTGKASYRAVALALLYHGWDTHLAVDWSALQRAARTALFSARKPTRDRAYGSLRAAIRQVAKRVKETLDRGRRADKRPGCQEARPVV